MTKGFTSKPKDCIFCGEPLPIPRNCSVKRHTACSVKYYIEYNKRWSGNFYKTLSPEDRKIINKKAKDYVRNESTERRFQRLSAMRERSKKNRVEVINNYGGKCACCSESILEFLSIDHINGGGKQHRKEIGGGGNTFYRWLKRNNYPEGFRVLCNNCNMSIGFYGYCPHQKLDQE